MIDIKLIREQIDLVKAGVSKKNFDPSLVDKVLELDKKRLELLQKVESLRQERNGLGKDDIERGKQIKEELKTLGPDLEIVEEDFKSLLNEIPNLPLEETPVGKNESENKELKTV